MLTLDETITAIKALNTEKDIIEQACVICVSKQRHTENLTSPNDIAKYLFVEVGSKIKNPQDFLFGLLKAAAVSAVALVEPGMELLLIDNCVKLLCEYFYKAHINGLEQLARENPEEATRKFLALLEGFKKFGKDVG